MMGAKGLADEAMKGIKTESKESESDPLETAVTEFMDASDPKARAAAFKAAVSMCSSYEQDDKE